MLSAIFFSKLKAQGSGLRDQGFALRSALCALCLKKALSFLLSLPVHLYRLTLSPFLGKACRHVPTCSVYMLDALKIHGPFTGFMMGLNRIWRCSPWGTHGYDPVPVIRFKKYKPLNTYLGRWKTENRLKR